MNLKRCLSGLLLSCFFIFIPLQAVFAAPQQKLPGEFWKLAPLYEKAVNSNDMDNIIIYGNKIIELFKGSQQTEQVLQIVAPRLDKVARAYEATGKYGDAARTFAEYIPLAEKLGWTDGVTYARSKVNSLSSGIELYAKIQGKGRSSYFGAKYEPVSGVYFGSCYDLDPRIGDYNWSVIKNWFPRKNSAYLLYLHWEEAAEAFDRYYRDAEKNNIALQLAWNIDDASIESVLRNISSYEKYIKSTADYLGKLKIPVFLRFAGEMNIKENCRDYNAYITAFRYVSGIMKSNAPNVAMVWSPNDISAKGRTYDQYYPGDEYVDWIGISSYTSLYFQGKKDWGIQQDSIDSVYMTGSYANPLAKLKPIMDSYGSRKPIMLSETGIGHYSKTTGEDISAWASVQLRRLYIYGPMVYPQLKGIYYFNADNDSISRYDNYSLYGSPVLNSLYNQLVENGVFISDINGSPAVSYEKITDYTIQGQKLEVCTYAIVPKMPEPRVVYRLDGNPFATRSVIPYSLELDLSTISKGEHLLKVQVYDGDTPVSSTEYSLIVDEKAASLKKR